MEALLVLGVVAAILLGALLIGVVVVIALAVGGVFAAKEIADAAAPPPDPMASVALTPIARAPEGELVAVAGRVEPLGEPVVSPLAGRPCVLFATELARFQKRNRLALSGASGGPQIGINAPHSQSEWAPFRQLRDGRAFALVGETGRARVVVEGAALHLRVDDEETCGGLKSPSPRMRAFLERHAPDPPGGLLQVQERRIEPGDRIVVRGRARWEPAPEGTASGYRQGAQQLVLEPAGQAPVTLSGG